MNKAVRLVAIGFALLLAVSIIGGVLSLLFAIPEMLTPDVGKETVYTFDERDIDSLDIELSAADLKITRGDELTVSVSSDRIKVSEKKGELAVTDTKSFISIRNKAYKVEITLPEAVELEKADIDTGAGEIEIEGLVAERLTLELGAGRVKISEIVINDRVDISGGAGELEISAAEITDLNLDAGVGAVKFDGRLSGSCDIDCGVGECELNLEGGKESYSIIVDTGLGNYTIDGEKMRDGQIYGNGECIIDIDGGVGEVSVEFSGQ